MKIAIVSDSHDNMINLKKVLDYLQDKKIKNLIHCGDLTSSDILEKLRDFQGNVYLVEGNADLWNKSVNSSQQTAYRSKKDLPACKSYALSTAGRSANARDDRKKDVIARSKTTWQSHKNLDSCISRNDKIVFFGKDGEIEIDTVKIGFTHKPKDAKALLKKGYDFVFYGHTHRPDIKKYQISNFKCQKDKETIMANPGNIMGQPYKATFAILDTKDKRLELVGVEKI